VRKIADTLEREADADTPQGKRRRTLAIRRLSEYARRLLHRTQL